MHNELKKTNKNIIVQTNTSDSTRDSCLVHNIHTIKKEIVSKKTLVAAWVPALSWCVTYPVAENKLDTTGIHFCTIKNELVQVKR